MNRGFLFGLDGADFEFLARHRDSLPVFDRLASEGAWGPLRSTIPPATSAAWTAALSGMSPARTGVTDFEVDGDEEQNSIVDSTNVRVPRVWDIVGANGGRSAVVGVPVTYPVTEINGLMVGGFLSPDDDAGRTYPPELSDELPENYRFSIAYSSYGPNEEDRLLEDLYASTDAKFDFLARIIDGDVPGAEEPFDLICFVLSESDWIQHYFLKHPEEPGASEGEAIVLEYFQHVDERMGEIFDRLPDDYVVGLLSDHGFGKRTTHHVYLNEWLKREGYLSTNDEDRSASAKRRIGARIRDVAQIPGFSYVKRRLPKSLKSRALSLATLSEEDIDWSRTKAVFRRKFYNTGYVDLNTDGLSDEAQRELVDELVAGLQRVRHPETGAPVIESVYRSNAYYDGPGVETLPEIVFVFAPEYAGNEAVGSDVIIREIPEGGRPGVAHRMDGFYMLSGETVAASDEPAEADILDFAPTLYSMLELSRPKRLDGQTMANVVTLDSDTPTRSYEVQRTFLTESDGNEEVRDRLRDLGYM